jgi:hypothetical protein
MTDAIQNQRKVGDERGAQVDVESLGGMEK